MSVPDAIRAQIGFWHGTVDQMLGDCNGDVLHTPQGTSNSIAATYAHAVLSEDLIVHTMLQGKPSIYETQGWAAKTGVPFPGFPPAQTPEWASSIKMNLPAFKEYAQAAYAATDAYLASLTPDDLARKTPSPFGEQTIEYLVTLLVGTHFTGHAGEIAALKGVQGLKGLPF